MPFRYNPIGDRPFWVILGGQPVAFASYAAPCGITQLGRGRLTRRLVSAFLPGLLLVGCHGSKVSTPPAPLGAASLIDPKTYATYDKHSDPDVYAKWGDDGIAQINRLVTWATTSVQRNPECGQLDVVSLVRESDGTVQRPFQVYADCESPLRRFHVSEAEMGGTVRSDRDRGAVLARTVVDRCLASVKAQLKYPSTIDLKPLSVSSELSAATGNWRVDFNFDADNAMGTALPQRASCTVSPAGEVDAWVGAR